MVPSFLGFGKSCARSGRRALLDGVSAGDPEWHRHRSHRARAGSAADARDDGARVRASSSSAAASADCTRRARSSDARVDVTSSIGPIITSSSRCSTRWRRRRSRHRHRRADPLAAAQAAQHRSSDGARSTAIDVDARRVSFDDGASSTYDYLIVATGARHSYFGHDEWERRRAGPQEHRRRDRASAGAASRVRACRAGDDRRTDGAADLRHHRRRPDRRRARGHAADDRAARAAAGFPAHRHRDRRASFCSRAGRGFSRPFPRISPREAQRDLDRARRRSAHADTLVTDVGDGFRGDRATSASTRTRSSGRQATPPSPLGRQLGSAARSRGTRDREPRSERARSSRGLRRRRSRGDVRRTANRCRASRRRRSRAGAPPRETSCTRSRRGPRAVSATGTRATLRRSADTRRSALIAGMHLCRWLAWWTWLFLHILYLAGFRNRAQRAPRVGLLVLHVWSAARG